MKTGADACFAKSSRLLASKQYTRTFRQGRKQKNTLFLLVKSKPEGGQPRIGITVSKKVSKLAVCRNRIKRQIREVFRLNQHQLAVCDFVVIAQREAANADNKAIVSALENLLFKASQSQPKN